MRNNKNGTVGTSCIVQSIILRLVLRISTSTTIILARTGSPDPDDIIYFGKTEKILGATGKNGLARSISTWSVSLSSSQKQDSQRRKSSQKQDSQRRKDLFVEKKINVLGFVIPLLHKTERMVLIYYYYQHF